MKKIMLMLLLSLIIVQSVNAINCEDRLDNGSDCLMVTPSLVCDSYVYDMINIENKTIIVDDESLSLLNNSVYYFNFTEETGNYLIQLCDNSTREFRVTESYDAKFKKEVDARMYISIIVVICVLIGSFIFMAMKAKDFTKETMLNNALVMLFFFGALALSIVGLQIAKEIAIAGTASANISTLISSSYKVALWTLYVMVAIVFIIGLYNLLKYAKESSGLVRKRPSLYSRGIRR